MREIGRQYFVTKINPNASSCLQFHTYIGSNTMTLTSLRSKWLHGRHLGTCGLRGFSIFPLGVYTYVRFASYGKELLGLKF